MAALYHKSNLATFDTDIEEVEEKKNDDLLKIGGCIALGATAIFSAVAAINAISANKTVKKIDDVVSDLDAQVSEAEKQANQQKADKKEDKSK